MPEERPQISQRTLIGLIIAGLVVWAVYLAIGAFLYNLNPWRAVIVLGCMGAFIGIWLLLLATQKRNKQE